MKRVNLFLIMITLIMYCLTTGIKAHGLDLDIQIIGSTVIKGGISFSDEDGASGQYIRIENLTDTNFSTIILQANKYGEFMLKGVPGHRYRITVEGDEDHTVSKEIVLESSANLENPEHY